MSSSEYEAIGYQHLPSLLKTDIKWLVERLGEPLAHRAVRQLWPNISRGVVIRKCWEQLRSKNEFLEVVGLPSLTMRTWLESHFRVILAFEKDARER